MSEFKEPEELCIDTQKDATISRLLLQRFYSTSYNGMYSDSEINFTLENTIESDKQFFDKAYNAMSEYKAATGYNWLVD